MSDKRWTCWYWPSHLNDPDTRDVPVPYSEQSNDLDDLRSLAQQIADGGGVSWVKVFATNNERDERYRWPAAFPAPSSSPEGPRDA